MGEYEYLTHLLHGRYAAPTLGEDGAQRADYLAGWNRANERTRPSSIAITETLAKHAGNAWQSIKLFGPGEARAVADNDTQDAEGMSARAVLGRKREDIDAGGVARGTSSDERPGRLFG